MSLDAGGLAQMTYNPHNSFANGLSMPSSGFATRGKGSHIKRLSVAPPNKIPTIDETQQVDPVPTPRTSRSHLLAGLRTAPKSATFPASAPPTQLHQSFGHEQNRYLNQGTNTSAQEVPQTAIGSGFSRSQNDQLGVSGNKPIYSLPEQILAPPVVQGGAEEDPEYYAQVLALTEQRIRLQQQLQQQLDLAAQFGGINLNTTIGQQQQFLHSPAPSSGFYQQQLQNGMQPIIQAVPNQPGLYSVYSPMTGQHTFMIDNSVFTKGTSFHALNQEMSHSPPPPTPTFRAQVSPPPQSSSPASNRQTSSPPKSASPPSMDVNPLPPPSATAFRRGHNKALSLTSGFGANPSVATEAPKTGGPKSAGFPHTPMTGTFGPGQARAGDHPIRQPRGPPSLEELIAKPTTKFEGSKNFATRQRRRAVHTLARAGLERRGASRGSGSIDSLGSMTPASECEITFSISSDGESDDMRSGSSSLSGKPSLGSLRAAANGAIGSEMKERSRDRNSTGIFQTGAPSNETVSVGGTMAENEKSKATEERRKAPLLVLTSAEKRKSSVF
ncbi:MAG: hypothetical protein Q9214_005085 [Letrouitia sp. 1 TL-2023]